MTNLYSLPPFLSFAGYVSPPGLLILTYQHIVFCLQHRMHHWIITDLILCQQKIQPQFRASIEDL